MNSHNLTLLANYLEALPSDYKHFAMSHYMTTGSRALGPLEVGATIGCGTSACALGHAPFVTGLPKPNEKENWSYYSERIFDMSYYSDEWGWCFSCQWASVDDTPQGAAARIKHLVKNETKLPCNFFFTKEALEAVDCYRGATDSLY